MPTASLRRRDAAAPTACQRVDCVHNEALECSAPSIRVGAGPLGEDRAECLTFTAR